MYPALTRIGKRITEFRFERSRFFSRYPFPFVVTFIAFAVATILVHYKYRFWPGQDDNYDDFCTMVVARWGRDPFITHLFQPLKWWHSQTFLYLVAGNLGKVMEPTAAMRLVFVACYFLGVPLVNAWILTEEKRSPWGAIVSFPLMYTRTWSFGFLKYAMSAPFFLLTLYAFVRIFREKDVSWKGILFYFVMLWILYMSHTQAFAFAGVLMVILWVGFLLDRIGRAMSTPPEHLSLAEFLRRSVFALGASLPALYACVAWFKQTQLRLGPFADSTSWSDTLLLATEEKMRVTMLLLAITKAPNEFEQVVFLFVVVVFCAALRKVGSNDRSPIPEMLFGVTFVSQLILPGTIHAQMIGQRHMDMALWILPLCITPALWKRNKIASALGVIALVYYSRARLTSLFENLAALNNQDLAGLEAVVSYAPDGHYRITQATFGEQSTPHWQGYTIDQNFAYIAARKGYDAPIYDTRIRAMEIRYWDAPPSPPTLMLNDYNWWHRPDLWKDFDLVLTYKWRPSTQMRVDIDNVASSVGHSGEWELWKRKDLP